METISITKKELKDRSYETTYRGVGVKIVSIWFDRSMDGYKYMVAINGGTKKQALDHMHHWLNNGMIGYNPNIKVWMAESDEKRKKPPVGFNWSHW
jgi:hypothetical protein